jgi:hypothetical protein
VVKHREIIRPVVYKSTGMLRGAWRGRSAAPKERERRLPRRRKWPQPDVADGKQPRQLRQLAVTRRHRSVWEARRDRNLSLIANTKLDPMSLALARTRIAECDRIPAELANPETQMPLNTPLTAYDRGCRRPPRSAAQPPIAFSAARLTRPASRNSVSIDGRHAENGRPRTSPLRAHHTAERTTPSANPPYDCPP